jgi:hypothetical protein
VTSVGNTRGTATKKMAEIKGTVLIDSIKAIKARGGEAEFQKIVKELSGATRTIFEGRISPSSWYPVDAFAEFLEADIRETAGGVREVLISRAEKVIENQLRGIYRVFVKYGSPMFVVKRIAAVHATYYNGIEIMPQAHEANGATIRYVGLRKRHEIMGFGIIGFFRKALEISGARDVSVKFTVPISDEKEYAELTIHWS